MSEVKGEKYILNGDVQKSDTFNDAWLSSGTTVYEVIRIINHIPLFIEDHLRRLQNSLNINKIKLQIDFNKILKEIVHLSKENKISSGNIKIIINSTGDFLTKVIYFINHSYPAKADYTNGVKTTFIEVTRKNPNSKTWNPEYKARISEELNKGNYYELILTDSSGNLYEGSKSNIFGIKNNVVFTAPSQVVLCGITREKIFETCHQNKISINESFITQSNLSEFQALFITGTSPKVLPIYSAGKYVFDTNHNILSLIQKKYDELIAQYIRDFKF